MRLGFRWVRAARWLGIALLSAALAVLAVREIGFLHQAERFVGDVRLALLLPQEPQHPDIVIVAITEETLEQFPYRSPVDRAFLANLLGSIEDRGARAIAIDILFDQPTEPGKDAHLSSVLDGLRVPLVVSYLDMPAFVSARQKDFLDEFVAPRLRGLVNLVSDEFGVVRWHYPGHVNADGAWIDSAPRALAKSLGVQTPPDQVEIAWRGRPSADTEPFRIFPAHLVPVLPSEWFRDKIVLVGAVLTLSDRHRTPLAAVRAEAGILPGVVVFAHKLGQLLDGRSARSTNIAETLLVALLFAAVGGALGILRLSLVLRVGASLVALAVLWSGTFALFSTGGPMLPLIAPTIALSAAAWANDYIGGREARRQKEFVQRAFGRFVSPKIVERLVADPAKLGLEGERREMTFIFTDLADFTTLSESLGSRKLARILNEYLDGMTQVIHEHEGTVDKFIGDAVFAIFNAPSDQPDHAGRAVRCALALDAFSEQFRARQLAQRGVALGVTRIGVHSGRATVGNFGSASRMEYTALGDAVNTASRLEGINKYTGTRIAVSQASKDRVGDAIPFRPVALVQLKGKRTFLSIWEPLEPMLATSAFIRRYRAAYAAMAEGNDRALELFQELEAEYPYDGPTQLHLRRLRAGERTDELLMEAK